MIRSFRDRETRKIWNGERSRRLPVEIQDVALRKLRQLNRSMRLEDLRIPPGNGLEALTKDRKGQHSIAVNDQWRICFIFEDGDAYDVELCDSH